MPAARIIPISISVDRFYLKEILRAIISHILFHRTFSCIVPCDVWLDSLSVGYCRVKDTQMQEEIDIRIEEILASIDNTLISQSNQVPQGGGGGGVIPSLSPLSSSTSTIFVQVSFFDKTSNPSSSKGKNWLPSFTILDERQNNPWEEWVVGLTITRAKNEKEQIQSRILLSKALEGVLQKISLDSGKFRENIPSLSNSDPFPFVINYHIPQQEISWTKIIGNLLPGQQT